MFVEVVFAGLPVDRGKVEEALEAAFELDGEVTGAGSGMGRCHLDLDIAESSGPAAALGRLRAVLSELGVAGCATLHVSE